MTVTAIRPAAATVTQQVVAPPQVSDASDPTRRSPGEELAAAVAAHPTDDVTVTVGVHLPAAFPLFAARPRYAVRHLLKTAPAGEGPIGYVYEPALAPAEHSGTSYEKTPEATFAAELAETSLTYLPVSVPVPHGLPDQHDLFARFVDYRVLVRVSVRENQTLLHGSSDGVILGLLRLPGARRRSSSASLEDAVIDCAWRVEETGGSCDGIVAHPATYWDMVRTGLLGRLQASGVVVSRTRMIPRNKLLLGDFRAAATLLLPETSTVALRRGAGKDGQDVVEACAQVGLAVHLPQHLVILTLDGDRG